MLHRACLVLSLVLLAGQATGGEKSWVLSGRVLDQQGQSVANVGISFFWNANGLTLEGLQKFEKEGGDDTMFSINEGRMEPWGHPAKTDEDGNFSIKKGIRWSKRIHNLLAIDKERKRGALIVLDDPHNARPRVEVKLVPLVRLHGRVRIAATGENVKAMTVTVRVPPNEKFPLGIDRVARCSSLKSRFEFWLPPGDYQFEVGGYVTPPHYTHRLIRIRKPPAPLVSTH
jgi:hypothetical protein